MNETINQPSPNHKLFAIYHHHEYGGGIHLLWSETFPTEEQVVESLEIDFEPEKQEFIVVDGITEIATLTLS